MAEVTVEQLAADVGATVERLLTQMQEAGLSHEKPDQVVTDDEKQQLLAFLKRSHGESAEEPARITLKRKRLSTLKMTGTQGRNKTVNVEVRKKRTYIKRGVLEDEVQPLEEAAAETLVEETDTTEAGQAAPETTADGATPEAQPETATEEQAEKPKKIIPDVPPVAAPGADAHRRGAAKGAHEKGAHKEREEARPRRPGATKREREKGGKWQKEKEIESFTPGAKVGGIGFDQPVAVRRGTVSRPKVLNKVMGQDRHGFARPTAPSVREVEVPDTIQVAELAQRLSIKSGELIKTLMKMGVMATVNESIDQDTAVLVVEELGHRAVQVAPRSIEETLVEKAVAKVGGEGQPRAPVVTVMGHVDHGKTSLLDYIRKSRVATGEAGGITQHIGAYRVKTDKGEITFLDTPGHAAFTAMRARGAKCTDIVVLVVAADDGVMPQTEEAILHARAAGVPLVVAINKIDREDADPERVRNELSQREVISEDWGGDTQFLHVSAHTGQGVEDLLDAIVLQSELLELKAPVDGPAQGVVIESRIDKGRGPVATLLIQAGTLTRGEVILAGSCFGRVRAMQDENGQQLQTAGPSTPIEVLGLNGCPEAGDEVLVVEDERKAREVADFRNIRSRDERMAQQSGAAKFDPFAMMAAGEKRVLNIVLKADVRGSLEALQSAIADISTDEAEAVIVSGGVGGISETDASLALASGAVIFGFNVRAEAGARKLIEKEGLDLRYYSVIYDILDDVRKMLEGMLAPELREEIIGVAEVRDVFRSPKYGNIAGCMVIEGNVKRNQPIRVLRDDVVIYEGELESLRRFKEDVGEVRNGMECGIGVKNYNDVKPGDKIEVYRSVEVARTLGD